MDAVRSLQAEIDELKNTLLDSDVISVVPPDDITRRHELLISSFVILAHAHIEEFIEHLFQEYVERREAEITKQFTPYCFVFLSISYAGDIIGQKVNKEGHGKICTTLKNLYLSKVVNANNGLKQGNVVSLAKPLGLHEDALVDDCDTLFAALNTLGGKRGKMAHTSSSKAAMESVYAGQAIQWVDDVVGLIHQLVAYLDGSA